MLESKEIPEEAIDRAKVVHSSTFALSREPCRSAVIGAFRKAREMGKIVSLDPNYSRRVWPDYKEALGVIREAYKHVNVTKPSADDARRSSARLRARAVHRDVPRPRPRDRHLHDGREGNLISEGGKITAHVPTSPWTSWTPPAPATRSGPAS
jgi:sugar/nucleoside kinase (ribokinase family)